MTKQALPGGSTLTARELRRHLMRRTRKLRSIYRTLIVLVCVAFLGLCAHVIFYYNYLTDLHFDVQTAQGKVGSAIQYRTNLLPVLVETVVSFVEHEDSVFSHTVESRERELSGGKQLSSELKKYLQKKGKGTKGLTPSNAFERIMAIAEQYPQLKTSDAVQLLMKQIADAEVKILAERVNYNDRVNVYTTALTMFPGNVYGYLFGFPMYDYFKEQPDSEWPALKLSRWPREDKAEQGG